MKTRRILSILLPAILLAGCAIQPLQPWERDLLAEPEMQTLPDPMDHALDEHTYFSKEAAHGGDGVGGGGCGCN